MLTQNQMRAKVYNAITNDLTLTGLIDDRLYWIQKPTETDVYPLITYKFVDTIPDYSFGGPGINAQSEEYTVQLDVYTGSNDIVVMDNICEQLKVVMSAECMRLINSNVEFAPDGLQDKIVRPQRWEYINV